MPTSRLFIALWPPSAVLEELAREVAPLREALPDLKWQPPQRWHITVAFLGERDEELALTQFGRIRLTPAGTLAIAGAGTFGPVLYAGVEADDWLKPLAHQTRRACRVRERKRYRPHVTLGRARQSSARDTLEQAVESLLPFRGQGWQAEELTLVRSTTGPQPDYEVIATSQLPKDA